MSEYEKIMACINAIKALRACNSRVKKTQTIMRHLELAEKSYLAKLRQLRKYEVAYFAQLPEKQFRSAARLIRKIK